MKIVNVLTVAALYALAGGCALFGPDGIAVRKEIFAKAERQMVRVQIDILKDEEKTRITHDHQNLFERKQPLERVGVAYLYEGEPRVLISDPYIKRSRIGRIAFVSRDGQKAEGEFLGYLENADGVVFRFKDGVAPEWLAPENFAGLEKAGLADEFYQAHLEHRQDRWDIFVGKFRFGDSVRFSRAGEALAPDAVRSARDGVVYDREKNPVGFFTGHYNWFDGSAGYKSWRGRELASDALVTDEKLAVQYEALLARIRTAFRKIKVELRDDDAVAGRWRDAQKEHYFFGIVYDTAGHIFVPVNMPYEQARLISKVYVYPPAEDGIFPEDSAATVDGEFVGLFRSFGGMIFKTSDTDGIKPVDFFEAEKPALGLLHYVLWPARIFGKDRIDFFINRYYRETYGYENMKTIRFEGVTPTGSFVFDKELNLRAFCGMLKMEDPERRSDRYGDSIRTESRVFTFAEVRNQIGQLADLDTRAQPKSLTEQKKEKMWFGVEYQSIGKLLAENMDVEKETEHGRLGLLITHVYENSPAARAGIRKNDILLKLKEDGKDIPRELKSEDSGATSSGWWGPDVMIYEGATFTFGMNFTPSRSNNLIAALTEIGEGKAAELTYLRDRKLAKLKFTIERAPVDFDMADKYKDEALGLTVKDITYEVRWGLDLGKDFTGVVVDRIEPGMPAQVAQIGYREIVTTVNNVKVRDRKHFEALVKELETKKVGKITMVVFNLEKSRFVDLVPDYGKGSGQPSVEKDGE